MDRRGSEGQLRRATLAAAALTIAAVLGAVGHPAAEPYLSVRTGHKCSACHVNKTGGGKRTGFGTIYAQTRLPHVVKTDSVFTSVLDPNLNEFVSVGGDLRFANHSVLRQGENANGFEITEGNLYIHVDAIRNFLSLYIDETVAPGGASNREAFAVIQAERMNFYAKAGRMLLPYGLGIWDEESFIRRKSGFNYANQDLGIEVGAEPGPLSFSAAFTNGTQGGAENNLSKQVSLVGSFASRRLRIGGSFSRNDGPSARRIIGGPFGGFNAGRFTVLGEYAIIDDQDDAAAAQQFGTQRVAYAECDLLIAKGVNVKFAYDYWDPFEKIEEDARTMYRIGVEPFLTQFLQLRAFYRFREAPPGLASENHDRLDMELHLFF